MRDIQQQTGFGFLVGMEKTAQHLTLADRFLVPPFSVLDTRQGYWQERKRQWLALGIQSEVGRGEDVSSAGVEEGVGSRLNGLTFRSTGFMADAMKARGGGTSVFDPVLCELAYKWFCPKGGSVLDQFAGGSVRGIVAEVLGYKYTGIEIREEQIAANDEQAKALQVVPEYILGDCTKTLELIPQGAMYDLVFTCPPYYDLEVYSDVTDNMGDMSVYHSYFSFMLWYEVIFKQAVIRLKPNRFLVVVVSDIRDKEGVYRGFVADNIACFKKLGLKFYNEAILVNVAGTLPIRVSNQFPNSRKLGRSHQVVLVFYKGDPQKIKDMEFVDTAQGNEGGAVDE